MMIKDVNIQKNGKNKPETTLENKKKKEKEMKLKNENEDYKLIPITENRYTRHRVKTENKKPSKTDQTQITEANIYCIIEKYGIQGRITDQAKVPIPMDLRNVPTTLEEYSITSKNIEEYYNNLPSKTRQILINANNLKSMLYSGQIKDINKLKELNIIEKDKIDYEDKIKRDINTNNTNNNQLNND